jgi:predicted transcriptional regulator
MHKADMDKGTAPQTARPRNPYTKALRRERIFSRLQLGASSADIAREEGLSEQRVRKIVADALKRQQLDDPPDHALLQLFRLERAHTIAAEAVAAGDLRAITPYLQVLDRIDRHRKTAARKDVYDVAARERLFAKLDRIAAQIEAEARKAARGAAAQPPPGNAQRQPDSEVRS